MNNQFIFIGRLTKKPELKQAGNTKVTNVYMAIDMNKEETFFANTTAFGKLAETIATYCEKGDTISVSGYVKAHSWKNNEGNNKVDIQFIITRTLFINKAKPKPEAEKQVKEENTTKDVYEYFGNSITAEQVDDLPF